MSTYLDFEKPIAELEGKIKELRHLSDGGEINIVDEITRLQNKAKGLPSDFVRKGLLLHSGYVRDLAAIRRLIPRSASVFGVT